MDRTKGAIFMQSPAFDVRQPSTSGKPDGDNEFAALDLGGARPHHMARLDPGKKRAFSNSAR